ncbi:MAG TPA: hypothetical protein VOA87_07120 [Thermoanaerobaculia bacterium]|nr:hypothetical protein [Thermoanaerobaculia bacterium]
MALAQIEEAAEMAAAGPAELAAGAALALLVGASFLWPRAPRRAATPAGLALALVAGVTLLVALSFPLARLGAPFTGGSIAAFSILLAAVSWLTGRFRTALELGLELEPAAPGDHWSAAAGLLVVFGLALFAVKLSLAPLWTWDHFAVWGIKTRRMVVDGMLDLGFIDLSVFRAEPHYPLGLPWAWRLLSFGALPGDFAFKACHALFALALVAVTRHGALLLSGSRRIANGLAAWLAVSPVLWDTIGVGHADLPLALWMASALVVGVSGLDSSTAVADGQADGRGIWPLALAGALAGFLPWIKQEGVIVALAIVAALGLLIVRSGAPDRLRRLLALVLLAGAMIVAGRLELNVAHTHGIDFFAGPWWTRAAERIAQPGEILHLAATFLLAPDWLGFWIVFAAACVVAAAWRRGTAAILCGLVVALVGVYVSIYFVTSLPPINHLRGSFFRILCPLMPVGLLAIAALFRPAAATEAPE